VLLVEDNAINQQIATELLELVGIQVDVASNGQLAVDRLREMGPEFYRLVFMDVQMPEMDGHEATRLIRGDSRFSQLPIVAMTAHALLIERERCLSSGMNDHIAKPINPVELYQIVEKWCASSIEYIENLVDENPVVTTEELFEIAGIDVRQGLSRTMWDKQLYFKLLRLFVNEQKDVIERINACIENDDWRTAERVAHTFKGVASLIGADLHILAETIELAIKQTQDTELIKSLLKQCGQQLADLVVAILERLGLENALHDFEGRTQDGALLSSDVVLSKLRRCYKLVESYDGESLEALQDSVDELSIAFGTDVQKQIMRAANQYDFDVILSIMKGNARMCGIDLE
jgi:CheY-like chemotaxis protein